MINHPQSKRWNAEPSQGFRSKERAALLNSAKGVLLFCLSFWAFVSQGKVSVSVSAPVKPGGWVLSGYAKAIPHSGYSAAVATEKSGYQPIEMNIKPVANLERGQILLSYHPFFSTPGRRLIMKTGEVAVFASPERMELTIGQEIFSGPYNLPWRVWSNLELCWKNGKVALKVDDQPVIVLDRVTLPVAESVFFGGMPDGLLRDMSADNPLLQSPVEQIHPSRKLPFNILANNLNFISFDYFDRGQAQKLRIRPVMQIEVGTVYVVEQSGGEPFYVTAVTAGELILDLPGTWSNRVDIRRDPGNLLLNASFEEGLANWQIAQKSILSAPQPIGLVSELNEAPLPDEKTVQDRIGTNLQDAYEGKLALDIHKRDTYSVITIKSDAVVVQAKTRYLLGLYHQVLESSLWGGSFYAQVVLKEGGTVKRIFNEMTTSSPLRQSGSWRYLPVCFTTPEGEKPFHVEIELVSDGAPCRILVDALSLREYPVIVYNPMPPESDKARVMSQEALIEHLQKREGSLVPEAPLSGVAGYDQNCFKYMNQAGVDILWCKASTDWRSDNPEWRADGTYDFSYLDQQILHSLGYAPNGKIGLYMRINPAMDFAERFPNAAWIGKNGKPILIPQPDQRFFPERHGQTFPYVSYTAEDFRREAANYLQACGEHLQSVPWGKTVVAIHISGGGDGQWFYRPIKNDMDDLIDRSPGNLLVMREKLREYYHNDLAAFRLAWGDPSLTFEKVEFPDEALWRKYPYLRDPDDPAARRLIDLGRLFPEAINDALGSIALAFEKGLGHKVLKTRYYYGTALGHLLKSPYFDGLVSVPPYGNSRLHGVAGRIHQVAASATLQNKYFFTELDLRSSYSSFPVRGAYADRNWLGVEKGPENFAYLMRKMAAPSLVAGQGYWYYMIGGNSSYQDEFEAYIKESAEALHLCRRPAIEIDEGTAVFHDEKARTVMGQHFAYAVEAQSIHKPQEQWLQSGLAVQMYLLQDLDHPKRKPAKLNIFPLASTISEEQIRFVENKLQKDGNVLVFAFDAGRTAPGSFETNIRRLTGITVKHRADKLVLSRLGKERFSDPLSALIGMSTYPFSSSFMMPLFYVDDPSASALAFLDGTKLVGAAVKRHPDWTAVYFSVPVGFAFSPQLLRALAAEAGVKPVGPAGDVTYAGNGFLAIHANRPGRKRLEWSQPAQLLDISSGAILAPKTTSHELDMKFGETRWFRVLQP